jgi:hypothetical protein
MVRKDDVTIKRIIKEVSEENGISVDLVWQIYKYHYRFAKEKMCQTHMEYDEETREEKVDRHFEIYIPVVGRFRIMRSTRPWYCSKRYYRQKRMSKEELKIQARVEINKYIGTLSEEMEKIFEERVRICIDCNELALLNVICERCTCYEKSKGTYSWVKSKLLNEEHKCPLGYWKAIK